ncbi:MAG: hypothetical protein HGA55_07640, partial [Methanoregulaceae archaeon]|nr:hypothetical protein [Methanoregulaceae archaeon]
MEDGTRIRAQESHMALFVRFLRFGLLAWGGPIAQIAMIRQELVEEEKWVTNDRFNRNRLRLPQLLRHFPDNLLILLISNMIQVRPNFMENINNLRRMSLPQYQKPPVPGNI